MALHGPGMDEKEYLTVFGMAMLVNYVGRACVRILRFNAELCDTR